MVQAGAAALGIGAAAAVEFGGWCILNPYSCTKAISGAADAVMGDYVGGHSLAPVLPALVAAKAATTAEDTLRLSSSAAGAEIAGNAAKKGGAAIRADPEVCAELIDRNGGPGCK